MSEESLRILFEGDAIEARAGDSVASALLRAGVRACFSPFLSLCLYSLYI